MDSSDRRGCRDDTRRESRGTGLPLLLLLSLATVHDAPFACLLLEWTLRLYGLRPRIIGSIPASGACA
jgi:hypothetical protein